MFVAPISLHIGTTTLSPLAKPQEISLKTSLEDSATVFQKQEMVEEENNSKSHNNNNNNNNSSGNIELGPLPAAPACPEIQESVFLEQFNLEQFPEEQIYLVQSGVKSSETSPSKEKQRSRPLCFLKAATKGGNIISRVFNRRKSAR